MNVTIFFVRLLMSDRNVGITDKKSPFLLWLNSTIKVSLKDHRKKKIGPIFDKFTRHQSKKEKKTNINRIRFHFRAKFIEN